MGENGELPADLGVLLEAVTVMMGDEFAEGFGFAIVRNYLKGYDLGWRHGSWEPKP